MGICSHPGTCKVASLPRGRSAPYLSSGVLPGSDPAAVSLGLQASTRPALNDGPASSGAGGPPGPQDRGAHGSMLRLSARHEPERPPRSSLDGLAVEALRPPGAFPAHVAHVPAGAPWRRGA